MEILPIEIKHKEFSKTAFRGYDKSDVDDFFSNVSEEFGDLHAENAKLKDKLFQSRREIDRLRSIEKSLLDALKETQSEKEKILERSQKEADHLLKESKMLAKQTIFQAKHQANVIRETAKNVSYKKISEMRLELKVLEEHYRELDSHKDYLIQEMSHLVQDTVQKIKRVQSYKRTFSFEEELQKAEDFLSHHKGYSKAPAFEQRPRNKQAAPKASDKTQNPENTNEPLSVPSPKKEGGQSFFDQF